MGFFVMQKNLVAMIPKQLTIDLNSDLGEYQTENQYFLECQILNYISTCNIACGGHTGDEESMKKIIIACREKGVSIGAHPSYPDPEGFGRQKMKIDESTLKKSLIDQVCSFLNVSEALNVPASHVKPHGRLYNDAASNSNLAYLLISVINEINPELSIVGPPNSILADVAKKSGSSLVGEAFLDRRYRDDGSLVNRGHSGAILETITERCEQAESIVCNWTVKTESERFIDIQAETLCLHGDSSDALKTAQMVRLLFESKNIEIKSFAA